MLRKPFLVSIKGQFDINNLVMGMIDCLHFQTMWKYNGLFKKEYLHVRHCEIYRLMVTKYLYEILWIPCGVSCLNLIHICSLLFLIDLIYPIKICVMMSLVHRHFKLKCIFDDRKIENSLGSIEIFIVNMLCKSVSWQR